MIEKLVTSKTRIKILKLFLSHIDDRYYLRELERLLDESLSPLRRQLLKLTGMGILITEEEANLKYYRLNKSFEGLDELKKIALDEEVLDSAKYSSSEVEKDILPRSNNTIQITPRRFKYDLALLSFISVFVLITAIFVVYANTKNIKQVASLISNKSVLDSFHSLEQYSSKNATAANSGEMISRKWKIVPGAIPVLSSGETNGEKNSEEL